jgi:hypothetical protein
VTTSATTLAIMLVMCLLSKLLAFCRRRTSSIRGWCHCPAVLCLGVSCVAGDEAGIAVFACGVRVRAGRTVFDLVTGDWYTGRGEFDRWRTIVFAPACGWTSAVEDMMLMICCTCCVVSMLVGLHIAISSSHRDVGVVRSIVVAMRVLTFKHLPYLI